MSDLSSLAGAVSLPFLPASAMKYECTIHTLQLRGDDGGVYNVVLDLIRSDANPSWGIEEDHLALRAAVVDQAGNVVGATFVETPRDAFEGAVGRMRILDADRTISFVAARGPDGRRVDGSIDFEMKVDILRSGLAQSFAEEVKVLLETSMAAAPAAQQKAAHEALLLQLLVTDYPHTQHTGVLSVKLPGQDAPLTLRAERTRSTMSHHYGNSLAEYVFMASVPREGEPNFIAVIAQIGVDLMKETAGPEVCIPVGYFLRAGRDGAAAFSMLKVDANKGSEPGAFDMGSEFFGVSLGVKARHEAGSIVLNEGKLPARTAFGHVAIKKSAMLAALEKAGSETFSDVVIDITGRFLGQTGRDQPL